METRRIEVSETVDTLLVMSDLHSFFEPLEVLDEIIDSWPGSAQVVVAGDILSGGASPVETMEWARTRAGEFAVAGNHDEISLRGGEGEHPPYSEAGGFLRLDQRQAGYLQSLPFILDLSWKAKRIRVTHGHRRFTGERVSWMAKPSELVSWFGDPAVALTIVGHTHHPFVAERDGGRVANCGSTAGLLLGVQHPDGSISSWGDEAVFEAPAQIYSTFLAITIDGGELQVAIERFDYDRAKALARLREAKDPYLEDRIRWLETGLVLG